MSLKTGLAVALIDAGFVNALDALLVHFDNGGRGVETHQARDVQSRRLYNRLPR
jgi:hypothetical protein